jgi:ComF family protein
MPFARLLAAIAPPLCVSCGAACRVHDPLCSSCRRGLRWLAAEQDGGAAVEAWAAVGYEGPARALVGALKFRGAVRLADAMAAQMAANAPPGLLDGVTLVPVPLHRARRRRRGFNQAEQLARALAARSELRVSDCLERARGSARASQVGRGRNERLSALVGSVRLREGAPVPLRALLVDDVVTTGATLDACAAALARAGVRDIRAIVYARTPGR